MSKIFISYVKENRRDVEHLVAEIEKRGVMTWLDRKDIKPGQRWADAIRSGIRDGAFFIACFSAEYQRRNKSYMNEELTIAIEELRQRSTDSYWFIPVKLSPCEIPDRDIGGGATLRSLQWVDLFDDWDNGIARILSVIRPSPQPIQIDPDLLINFLHGLSVPLHGIAAEASNLSSIEVTSDLMSRSIKRIRSLADLSAMALRNFRAATYFFQNEQPMYQSRVSLAEELESLVRVIDSSVGSRKEINVQIDRGSLAKTVLVDTELMRLVFFNLLDNAVKYSYRGGTITVDGRGTNANVAVVNITNRGLSIPADESSHIFKFGYRSSSAKAVTRGGGGVGLYIASHIVQAHGGSLTYVKGGDPEVHTFRVTLLLDTRGQKPPSFGEEGTEMTS